MSDAIQPYRGPTAAGEIQLAEPSAYSDDTPPAISLLDTVRRRWLMVLGVWLLLAGCAIPYVLLTMQRSYKATAQLQVDPVLQPILYPDSNSSVMPFFDAYLQTQIELIYSHQVLMAALANPRVEDVPLMEAEDPVVQLRKAVDVKQVGRSHLIEIGVTQLDRDTAVRLAEAVVDAYMARVVEAEGTEQRKKLKVLEARKGQLEAELEQTHGAIQDLAQEYGTATDSMLNLLREGILQSTLETRREQERAELKIIQLRNELEQLEKGVTAGILSEDEAVYREQVIENDPVVVSLRKQLLKVSSQLIRLQSALTDEHVQVVAARQHKERLERQLHDERIRAADDAEKETVARRARLLEGAKAGMKQRLIAAQQRREILADRVKAEESKGMAIGRRGLDIQVLSESAERLKEDYDKVNDAIKRADIERYRPARISIASAAEVRPSGVIDKRFKWSVVLLFGTGMVSMTCALLRERLDSHLRNPQEIEAGMGLRILAVVPRLSELRSGRVTRDDFLESYRWVRATLSALGEEGSPPASILVTSAQAAEGKTSLAVSLAASLAEPGSHILLIDGDLQAPGIGRLLKLTPTGGLETLLLGKKTLADCVAKSSLPGVDVLVAGMNGDVAGHSLNYRSAMRILNEAAKTYDHVVIDSSPALSAANTLVWAHVVDGVIISSLASQSDTVAMRWACQRLRSVGANLLGSVIGNVSRKESFYSYSGSATSAHSEDPTRGRSGGSQKRREPPVVHLPDNDIFG